MRLIAVLLAPCLAIAAVFSFIDAKDSYNESNVLPSAVQDAEVVQEKLKVADGQRHAGPDRIAARRGHRLRLIVLSDREDELHIHGYDHHVHLSAGVPTTIELLLDKAGRFEVELHKAHTTLTVLEVQPR